MPADANAGTTARPDKAMLNTGWVPYGHDIAPRINDAKKTTPGCRDSKKLCRNEYYYYHDNQHSNVPGCYYGFPLGVNILTKTDKYTNTYY